jgi:hypothetical protein
VTNETFYVDRLRRNLLARDRQYFLKPLFVLSLAVALFAVNVGSLIAPMSFDATVWTDVSRSPSSLKTQIGTFSVCGDRFGNAEDMMPYVFGWHTKDISYSWEGIRKLYGLDSLVIFEYRSNTRFDGLVYVAIAPVEVSLLDSLHPLEYCYSLQGFTILQQSYTSLKVSRYVGNDEVEFSFNANLWTLNSTTHPNEGWIVAYWYVYVSTGHPATDKAYLIQVEKFLPNCQVDESVEDCLLFAKETMASMLGHMVESV